MAAKATVTPPTLPGTAVLSIRSPPVQLNRPCFALFVVLRPQFTVHGSIICGEQLPVASRYYVVLDRLCPGFDRAVYHWILTIFWWCCLHAFQVNKNLSQLTAMPS
jgi:hypothetical protein